MLHGKCVYTSSIYSYLKHDNLIQLFSRELAIAGQLAGVLVMHLLSEKTCKESTESKQR